MRVATYNLLKGGSKRMHWVRMLVDFQVDLLLAQESFPHCEHLPPFMFPDIGKQAAWESVKGRAWGSAVLSTTGVVSPISVPGYQGWVVGARITRASWQRRNGDPLLVFSVHAPSNGQAYATQVNRILDKIKSIAGTQELVIGGDFNISVSHFPCSERPTSKRDLKIQERLADEFNLVNCWQTANPEQPLHQTLRWTGDRTTAYHCDGIFVPKRWRKRLRSCLVLAGDEWNSLSDHNPIIAEFE